MDGRQSLLSKYLKQYIIYTTIITLCCSPLFILIIQFFYKNYLDQLIISRADQFITNSQNVTISEIPFWNKYDENMLILPYNKTYHVNSVIEAIRYKSDEKRNHLYRIIYREIQIQGVPYILMCRIPMMESPEFLKVLVSQLALIFLILFITLALGQRYLAKTLWAPFYNSLNKIEHYNLDRGNIPAFEKTDIKEFSNLNKILTGLISNNLKIYRQQKEFIENASHELQTPMAVFQSQLDSMLQGSNLSEEQINRLDTLYSISSRLIRLNKNLLLLAKIDNNQFKDMQRIDFVEFLKNSLTYFKIQIEAENIRMSENISNPLTITANKSLLESLVNNLIANAILHNTSNGTILIEIKDSGFIVSNTGENKALDPDKLFKRFSRTSEEKKGNGLGLSIVYQICKFHKWELRYRYIGHMHSFIVRFL